MAAALILFTAGGAARAGDAMPPILPATAGPTSPAVAKGIEISARALYAAYASNELLADKKYKGKLLRVSGMVMHVGREALGEPFVALAADPSGYGYETVTAYFPKNGPDDLTRLSKGMVITLTCKGDGMTLTMVVLDCR